METCRSFRAPMRLILPQTCSVRQAASRDIPASATERARCWFRTIPRTFSLSSFRTSALAADTLSEKPRCFVANVQLAREHHGRDALAGRGRAINRAEPCAERQVRAFHWRGVQDVELRPAASAVPVAWAWQPQRAADHAALRTRRTPGPTDGFQMRNTGFLVREAIDEIHQFRTHENRMSADESQ
jgi:hypothetical protein